MTWLPPRCHRNLPDPVTGFQVLGDRNSGTNYVTRLVERNFPDLPRNPAYGWKHGFIDRRVAETPGLLTIVVYRHPLRWLQSLHLRPLNLSAAMRGLPFGAFIRHEWQGVFPAADGGEEPSQPDMRPGTADQAYPNALQLRNARIGYLEAMAEMPGRIAFLRFEDANRAPQATLAALADAFDLVSGPFRPVTTFKGGETPPYRPRPMPRVAQADLDFIRRELDLAQEGWLGYDPCRPPRFDGLPAWDRRSVLSLLSRRAYRPKPAPADVD